MSRLTRRTLLAALAGVVVRPFASKAQEIVMAPEPFTFSVEESVLADLDERLARTRFPDQIPGSGWDYGTDTAYLRDLVMYWREEFDWRAAEAVINAFPNFRADVDGLGIHFIHAKGKGANAIPLLLLHGWPSSVVQMLEIIPMLTDPDANGFPGARSFDVVAPSLPGFGFSDIPAERGMSVSRMADRFAALMGDVLGYGRFAGRGSDLGAGVLQQLALKHPDRLIGLHLSGTNPYVGDDPADLTAAEQAFVRNAQQWTATEMAYAMLHASKPQTLAVGLNDSPAGLASWMVEKFRRWGDIDIDIDRRFTRDALLANIGIYWVTGTINSSMRLYYETVRDPGQWGRVAVPTAMLMSPKDMFPTPREWAERSYNVVRWTEIDRGGHFLEWEEPALVAADLQAFFRDRG